MFGAGNDGYQRQTYLPLTRTRTHAVPAAAAPTAAPPTTARLVVRRATPATDTGVKGRPPRASARLSESERPWSADQSIEPDTPRAITAPASDNFVSMPRFMMVSVR